MAQEFSMVFGVRGGTEAGPYINLARAFIAQHLRNLCNL